MHLSVKKHCADNKFIIAKMFNNNIDTRPFEVPGVVYPLDLLDYSMLRHQFGEFFKLYTEFIKVFGDNHGGMGCVDLFSFWYTLNIVKPAIVFENGVFNGGTTWIIRKTLPHVRLFCFDPRVPKYIDYTKDENNTLLTTYLTGDKFKDFKYFQPAAYGISSVDLQSSLAFFDCHTNALLRLRQSHALGIKKIIFNDNYPEHCGGHLTLQHISSETDNRFSTQQERDAHTSFCMSHVTNYILFPNIAGSHVKTSEGMFNTPCLFKNINDLEMKVYNNIGNLPEFLDHFSTQALRYRWNTFVELL